MKNILAGAAIQVGKKYMNKQDLCRTPVIMTGNHDKLGKGYLSPKDEDALRNRLDIVMLRTGGTMSRKRSRTLSNPYETPPSTWQDQDETDGEGSVRVERAAAGSSGGTGNSGQHGTQPGESVSPVARPLPYKHVTFTFVQRSWEEIDTSMSTLPITLALLPMLDDEMITVIKSVLPCSLGYRIHNPHVKISNFIILTDELQIRGNTPTELASFVQQSKIIHYMPKNFVTTGYTLSNKDTIQGIKYSDLIHANKKKPNGKVTTY
ncbi:hypothetical protein L9F63_000385 [Diploptera punctata]|uniref:Uncharacterized protein n=1 Tax=Diploptera punctata TaxID=6984 RepID=A0AAD8ESR7_DIPPU|nr:hypothetical protein L9F63_000385 [Diploptera punctata]